MGAQMGMDGVFVGSGIFKSGDAAKRARAIVQVMRFTRKFKSCMCCYAYLACFHFSITTLPIGRLCPNVTSQLPTCSYSTFKLLRSSFCAGTFHRFIWPSALVRVLFMRIHRLVSSCSAR